jgi:hypothetical protein
VEEKTIEKVDADSLIDRSKAEIDSDYDAFSESVDVHDTDSDFKAVFNSDRIVGPPCHAVEMGREKVIVAIEKGLSGDKVSEKVAENVGKDQGSQNPEPVPLDLRRYLVRRCVIRRFVNT